MQTFLPQALCVTAHCGANLDDGLFECTDYKKGNSELLIVSLTGMEILGKLFVASVEINGFFTLFHFEGMAVHHEMFWIHNFDEYF